MRDHIKTPRTPLSGTQLRDLATALTEGRPGSVPYADLAQLIEQADRHSIDTRAVTIARERLTAAVERGNASAAEHLARLVAVTR